ncbi:conserved hypothetical protein [Ricinus communis]|uniref:Uncharacterized protein n=1 Tax=Ricinus communis TaxID=3988 RepID=B9SF57_RICCO|nr:conserved hypothetical protein [Ricinus communis]
MPLLTELPSQVDFQSILKKKKWRSRFHYEVAWAENEDCQAKVQSNWIMDPHQGSLAQSFIVFNA